MRLGKRRRQVIHTILSLFIQYYFNISNLNNIVLFNIPNKKSHALFEAAHGSAPDIAGQSKANPISMTLSGALLLRQIGEIGAANVSFNCLSKNCFFI